MQVEFCLKIVLVTQSVNKNITILYLKSNQNYFVWLYLKTEGNICHESFLNCMQLTHFAIIHVAQKLG